MTSPNHIEWFQGLFSASILSGILKASALAGYRGHPVYIRGSKGTLAPASAILELMQAFFNLLENKKEDSVRISLVYFFFVFIHSYRDGNRRIGRFLMNVMCALAQYLWTIISVGSRKPYMDALEQASAKQNIIPFCDFLAQYINS